MISVAPSLLDHERTILHNIVAISFAPRMVEPMRFSPGRATLKLKRVTARSRPQVCATNPFSIATANGILDMRDRRPAYSCIQTVMHVLGFWRASAHPKSSVVLRKFSWMLLGLNRERAIRNKHFRLFWPCMCSWGRFSGACPSLRQFTSSCYAYGGDACKGYFQHLRMSPQKATNRADLTKRFLAWQEASPRSSQAIQTGKHRRLSLSATPVRKISKEVVAARSGPRLDVPTRRWVVADLLDMDSAGVSGSATCERRRSWWRSRGGRRLLPVGAERRAESEPSQTRIGEPTVQ